MITAKPAKPASSRRHAGIEAAAFAGSMTTARDSIGLKSGAIGS
jgi:hypothetical protein